MRELLLKLASEKFDSSQWKIAGDNLYIPCPYANKRHLTKEDKTPSFCIQVETLQCYCHSCKLKGKGLTFVRRILKFKGNFFPKSSSIKPFVKDEIKSIDIPDYCPSILTDEGNNGFFYITELRNPSYSKKDAIRLAKQFDIRYCVKNDPNVLQKFQGYLIISTTCSGTSTFTARATGFENSSLEQRHKHPKGSRVGSLLMNYDNVSSNTLILVEGPFDLFRVWCYGYHNVVATYGKCVSSNQKSLLLKKKPELENIIIFFDGEGYQEAKKLAKELHLFFNVAIIKLEIGEEPDTISFHYTKQLISKSYEKLGITNENIL